MSIQTYDNNQAILWGEFVMSAYNSFDKKNLNPDPVDFPAGWDLVANLNVDATFAIFDEKEFIGYIVRSQADPTQVGIVFRGTDDIMDWIDDFEFAMVDCDLIPAGGRCEDGFYKMYKSLTAVDRKTGETLDLATYLIRFGNDVTYTVTGHSLGGALANLMTVVLASQKKKVQSYTFAAPMTGNHDFANTYNSLVPQNYRIYNQPDIVPKVPSGLLGYVQLGGGIEINSLLHPEIRKSIICYHSLATYLNVLSSGKYPLGSCSAGK
ncbi:lipase family protein [Brevibacillus dissolubilis]|uniref:lipase family protein n=1 Tax=Brevibacillus dissolubilis TaxID=1844116 RepID=UPI001117A702|nr:lipase family protein [Brevibacillus dissolubilis]